MRRFTMVAMALAVALVPVTVQAQPEPSQQLLTISAAPAHSLPTPTPSPLAPLSLLGFALVGATADAKKSKKVTLSKTYLFNGQQYGPGVDIDVPGDFPDIDGETGDVIWPEGSTAARNQARSRSFSSPPNTGGVNTGEGQAGSTNTVSGKSREELDAMLKDDLVALADERGMTVTRGDGGDGEPTKQDYIDALSKTS